jgi:16S rRNA (guanine527-N7)-methyltransferase
VLIESVGKKADVVARCCEEALPGYPVSVVPLRTEVYARDHCRAASVAVSRAVGELPAVLELSAPLVRVGGICVAMKGDLTREELSRGDRAAEMLGMERKSLQRLVLPVGGEARSIVQYAVVEDASLVLPRREGLATKRPLG